jgi:hypothetical protein
MSENEVYRNADAFYWGFKDAMEKMWDFIGADPQELLWLGKKNK